MVLETPGKTGPCEVNVEHTLLMTIANHNQVPREVGTQVPSTFWDLC
jgi:hypothetical protein